MATPAIESLRDFASRVERLGCNLALDDVGTGFGSLTYLRHLPFGYLKIDAEFVRGLTESEADARIVSSLVVDRPRLRNANGRRGRRERGAAEPPRRLRHRLRPGLPPGSPGPIDLIRGEQAARRAARRCRSAPFRITQSWLRLNTGRAIGASSVHPALGRPHVPLVERRGDARPARTGASGRLPSSSPDDVGLDQVRAVDRARLAPRRRGRTASFERQVSRECEPTPSASPGSISTTASTPAPPGRPGALVVDRLPDRARARTRAARSSRSGSRPRQARR